MHVLLLVILLMILKFSNKLASTNTYCAFIVTPHFVRRSNSLLRSHGSFRGQTQFVMTCRVNDRVALLVFLLFSLCCFEAAREQQLQCRTLKYLSFYCFYTVVVLIMDSTLFGNLSIISASYCLAQQFCFTRDSLVTFF